MELRAEFAKFVGAIIKDPERMTCDTDPVADEMTALAAQHNLGTHFIKAGEPEMPTTDIIKLRVTITKDGVPADKPWGWRVSDLSIS